MMGQGRRRKIKMLANIPNPKPAIAGFNQQPKNLKARVMPKGCKRFSVRRTHAYDAKYNYISSFVNPNDTNEKRRIQLNGAEPSKTQRREQQLACCGTVFAACNVESTS